ncbi:MAG: GNAT family N-acetyltransferase [Proteobacteria bacterium]|nr:GNAT family N-acetyltransferase [Pseudomonadota bacterium]
MSERRKTPPGDAGVRVRNVQAGDLEAVIAIDAEVTRLRKPDYWAEIHRRYGSGRRQQRFFLVAEAGDGIAGYVIGEVRDWEFGSPRCGWVFAISVRPGARLAGVGSRLLEAICAGFRGLGVTKVRTLLARDNHLVLSFFRSQGMMAAPFIPLELDLGQA